MIATLALSGAIKRLRDAGIENAATDARILLAHALGIDRGRLTLCLPDQLTDATNGRFKDMVTQRLRHQPVSQITGKREFYGRTFKVTPDVLDPRPETELLVEAALSHPFKRVLDLGTGSGCILLSLLAERPQAQGTGSDISRAALRVAQENAARLQISAVEFVKSDWFANISGRFELIVSNPPYISALEMENLSLDVRNWEPAGALTPGGDGLDAYRVICARAPDFLTQKGSLAVEIGPTQAKEVAAFFQSAGFDGITITPDLDGRSRVISGMLR